MRSFRENLKTRLIFYLVGLNIVIFLLFYWNIASLQRNLVRGFEEDYSHRVLEMVESSIKEAGNEAVLLSDILLGNDDMVRAFADKDREKLRSYVDPVFRNWKEKYGVAQLHFINPNAVSYYRAHQPEKYGDDLTFRKALMTSIKKEERIVALEEGVGGYGIRCLNPVYYNSQFVGILDVGMSLEKQVGERLSRLEGEYFIKKPDGQILWQKGESKVVLTKQDEERVLSGEALHKISPDNKYILILIPLKDVEGKTVAFVQGEVSRENFVAAETEIKQRALLIILIGLLLLCLAAYAVLNSGLKNLTPLKEVISQVSEGDLTKAVDITTRDEIGSMARAFSGMLEKIKRVFYELFYDTSALTTNAYFMNDVAESAIFKLRRSITDLGEIGSKLKEAGQNLEEADAGVEEVAEASQLVAKQTQSLQETYMILAGEARQGKEEIDRIREVMDSLKTRMEEVEQKARELAAISSDIGQITNTIMAVSEQTNLLALNAAIESARAGEHGRGFAVVAEEVRKLAEETAGYTKQISSLVERVQVNIVGFVDEIGSVGTVVEESEKTTGAVIKGLENIINNIMDIEKSILDISSAVEEQSASTQEISAVVNEVSSVVGLLVSSLGNQIKEAQNRITDFEELAKVIEENNKISDRLRDILAQYRLPNEIILEQVKQDHLGFVKKHMFIVEHELYIDPANVTDHENCRLGRWIKGIKDVKMLKVFAEYVDAPHKQLHNLAKEAVKLNNEGRRKEATNALQEMDRISKVIVKGIDKMIENA